MGRRLRANSGKTRRPKASPVAVYMRRGNPGWSLPQAAHLLAQGYTDEHVASTTGYDIRVVRAHLEQNGIPASWKTTT